MSQHDVNEIISIYQEAIIKAYCWGRFKIMHLRFLDEIGQYLPRAGRVLDIGCGFGLFSLYYARRHPHLQIYGIDINANRIHIAQKAAQGLSLSNVTYEVANAITYKLPAALDGIYMLDIIHHMPRNAVPQLLTCIYNALRENSRLVIKDVDTKPHYKRYFTYFLDKLIDLKSEVNYWEAHELQALLRKTGFEVFSHSMVDVLPYPHVLYICQKVRLNSNVTRTAS